MYIEKQQDIRDCGLYLIKALHKHYYGRNLSINQLKLSVNYGPNGISVKNLCSLGEDFGIIMGAYEATLTEVSKELGSSDFITIIKNDGENHYVLASIKGLWVYISDSINGNYKVSLENFIKMYTGILIKVKKGEFVNEYEKDPTVFSYLQNNKSLFIWLVITVILSIIFAFTSTIFTKILMDKVIPGRLNNTLKILVLSFSWIAILKVLNSLFHSFLLKKLGIQIEWKLTDMYFYKLRNGKYSELQKLTHNDHLRRINLMPSIAHFISNVYFSIFSEMITMITSITLLIWIDIELFAITMAATFLVVLISLISQVAIKGKYDTLLNSNMRYYDATMENVRSLDDLRAPRLKHKLINKQVGSFKTFKQEEFRVWSSQAIQGVINHIIQAVVPILLMYFATQKIFNNNLSIGSMLMFVSVFHHFINPTIEVALLFIKIPLNKKNLSLISFVLSIEDEERNLKGLKLRKVKNIALKNFSFGYDKNLLKIKNLSIENGIHIRGKNGSGKSSLIDVISGKYGLYDGLLINGIAHKEYSLNSYKNKVFISSNKTFLQDQSVLESITDGDPHATKTFQESLTKYNLMQLFKDLNLSLQCMMFSNASNLSSGQRQLVKIMRLFAFDYEIIILDEALENIDEDKVRWLSNALIERQKGIFIEISHSKKYIYNAKEVDLETIN